MSDFRIARLINRGKYKDAKGERGMGDFVLYDDFLKLSTIQPYLSVFSKSQSDVRVMYDSPISHFYTFNTNAFEEVVIIVPDGSIEILFLCDGSESKAYLYGSPTSAQRLKIDVGKVYFGVRFHPGIIPYFLNIEPRLLVNSRYNLLDLISDSELLLEQIIQTENFDQRMNIFNEFFYNRKYSKVTSLACHIHQYITDNNGVAQMKDKELYLGYSGSYINRVFTENFGLSPKTYSLILRFQSNLKRMLIHGDIRLTDLASDQGYADQSHFFREFKKFTSLAPSIFLKKLDLQSFPYNLF